MVPDEGARFENLVATELPAFQLVGKPGILRIVKNEQRQIYVVSAADWLAALN